MKPVDGRYRQDRRTIAVVGGIRGLEPEYRRILTENNYIPRIYNRDRLGLGSKVESTDLIILFSGTVSHKMAEKVRRVANLRAIPLATIRRSSVTALRNLMSEMAMTSQN